MNQSILEALLGRSLTPTEATNRTLYLKIAQESLENLLCTSLCYKNETRKFEIREGYRTIFTGIFEQVNSVTLNGELTTDYTKMQFDNYNGFWYNSIVLDEKSTGMIEIDADWGFSELPVDLKMLQAQLFVLTAKSKSTSRVKSKKNEDFSITYTEVTDDQAFLEDNRRTIEKYRMCAMGGIRHGEVC